MRSRLLGPGYIARRIAGTKRKWKQDADDNEDHD